MTKQTISVLHSGEGTWRSVFVTDNNSLKLHDFRTDLRGSKILKLEGGGGEHSFMWKIMAYWLNLLTHF